MPRAGYSAKAIKLYMEKVNTVMGVFHILSVGEGMRVGGFLHGLDVELVSPLPLQSNNAKRGIAKILGGRYVKNGSGKIILIG